MSAPTGAAESSMPRPPQRRRARSRCTCSCTSSGTTSEAWEKESRAIQEQRRKLRASGAPEEQIEKLFREQQASETKLLASMKYAGRVGAFEGAGYEAKGLYRPRIDSIRFCRNKVGYGPRCQGRLERGIDQYSRGC